MIILVAKKYGFYSHFKKRWKTFSAENLEILSKKLEVKALYL